MAAVKSAVIPDSEKQTNEQLQAELLRLQKELADAHAKLKTQEANTPKPTASMVSPTVLHSAGGSSAAASVSVNEKTNNETLNIFAYELPRILTLKEYKGRPLFGDPTALFSGSQGRVNIAENICCSSGDPVLLSEHPTYFRIRGRITKNGVFLPDEGPGTRGDNARCYNALFGEISGNYRSLFRNYLIGLPKKPPAPKKLDSASGLNPTKEQSILVDIPPKELPWYQVKQQVDDQGNIKSNPKLNPNDDNILQLGDYILITDNVYGHHPMRASVLTRYDSASGNPSTKLVFDDPKDEELFKQLNGDYDPIYKKILIDTQKALTPNQTWKAISTF